MWGGMGDINLIKKLDTLNKLSGFISSKGIQKGLGFLNSLWILQKIR